MENSIPPDAYAAFSADYDRFVNWDERLAYEMPFIRRLLGEVKADHTERQPRLLDAACGTGMHAIALAGEGFPSAGADLSAGMVEAARRNAAAAGTAVELAVAGFGELETAFSSSDLFPFDTLLCLGNSLPHLLTPAALAAALADFAACLRKGGLLLIQNRNFDAVLAGRQRWMEPQSHIEGEREWLFLRFYDYDADGLITFNILTLQRSAGAAWQQQVTATRLNPLRQAQLSAALSAVGFGEMQCYGSMAGEPFDLQSSGNLVIAARVA